MGVSGVPVAVAVDGDDSTDPAAGAVFVGRNDVGISVGRPGVGLRPQAVKNLLNVSEPALSIMIRRKSRREILFISPL
jgi:hypothetical protein